MLGEGCPWPWGRGPTWRDPARDEGRMNGVPRVLIVAGEASGDLRGAELAREIRARRPDVEIMAVGGPHLRAAGARIVLGSEQLSVMGLTEVLSRFGSILAAWGRLKRLLRGREPGEPAPDLMIPIDFPDFNLRLARIARRAGVKVLYYVSPQVWAWRRYRVRTLARRVDHLAVVFPFEEECYRGLCPVTFVGHPALDTVRASRSREELRAELGLLPEEKLVALLPGSRQAEVRELLPVLLPALRALGPGVRGVIALASESLRPLVAELLMQAGDPVGQGVRDTSEGNRGTARRAADRTERGTLGGAAAAGQSLGTTTAAASGHAAGKGAPAVLSGRTWDLVAAADAVALASGSATLETALLGTPMVVLYRLSRVSFAVARRLVRVSHIAMPNLILERTAVPELVQDEATPERTAGELRALLTEAPLAAAMRADLAQVRARLGEPGAAARTADIALSLLPTV